METAAEVADTSAAVYLVSHTVGGASVTGRLAGRVAGEDGRPSPFSPFLPSRPLALVVSNFLFHSIL